jgi:hypothetical protein
MQPDLLTSVRLRCKASALIVSGALFGSLLGADSGGKFVPNQDESKVPAYRLPDPLVPAGGPVIADRASWESVGRHHMLDLFEGHVYGRVPADFQPTLEWKLDKEDDGALEGTAIRREYLITIGGRVSVRMLLYLPKDAPGGVPCFLGLNFRGNQRVEADPAITIETGYVIGRSPEVRNNRPTSESRGTGAERWPAKLIVGRGYALTTACCSNFDPDFDDGFRNGIHALDSALPIDQHQLIGLIAPRPIYVASATGDLWADLKGEFLALRHAEARPKTVEVGHQANGDLHPSLINQRDCMEAGSHGLRWQDTV